MRIPTRRGARSLDLADKQLQVEDRKPTDKRQQSRNCKSPGRSQPQGYLRLQDSEWPVQGLPTGHTVLEAPSHSPSGARNPTSAFERPSTNLASRTPIGSSPCAYP